jgi:hypothetical protein
VISRAEELLLIESRVAEGGVTRCAPKFAARVPYALADAEQTRRLAALKIDGSTSSVLSRLFDGD